MADSFDPYHVWLGIPRDLRPPTHYQLLAISPEEQDRAVISAAVTRQSAYVRNFQAGKHGADAARILSEIQAAKICLLDSAKRAAYDAQLEREAPAKPAAAAQPAGFALDLDALAGAAPVSAPPASARRPPARLQTFSRQKKSPPWQLPAIGVGIALLAVIVGVMLSRRGGPPMVEDQTVERLLPEENERHAAPTPDASEKDTASGGGQAGTTGPRNVAKNIGATESSQEQPQPGPLSLVADAGHPPTTPGVVAESIVLHNSHNAEHRDRGTRRCNLSLWRDGREVWRKDAIDMDWSRDDERKTTVPVPATVWFDRVRVEVVSWENLGAALAEIEVLSKGRNLALGCPAVGFTSFDSRYTPTKLTDGDVTSYHDGQWLLPDNSPGWAEVDLAFASPRPSPGVLADELVIWNTHNAHHNDRGALELSVRLSLGDGEVWRRDGLEIDWRGGSDAQVTVPLPAKRCDRVRIEIPRWTDLGAGLTEVQVRRDGVNLARACPTIASGRLYDAADPAKAVDGITNSAVDFTGFWLAPDRTPAWIEIDLSCNCPALGRAHRELGQYRALVEKDWLRGLPWLARAESVDLRALALLDASSPSDAWQVASVGDGWWDFAEASSGSARDDLMVRAASQYARCLRGLTGAERARLEKRIAQCLPRPEGTPLYLLRETQVSRVWPDDNLRRQVIWRGEEAAWGLWMCPYTNESSRAAFALAKEYRRLTGTAAIADTSGGLAATPMSFKIVGDGRTLWTSPPLEKLSAGEPFDVSVAGIDRLELVVECPGSYEHCHAVWIDPSLDATGELKLAKAKSWAGVPPSPDTNAAPQTSPRERAAASGNTIDLLSLIDLERDVLLGDWKFDGRGLSVAATPAARIELPVSAPDEYELTLNVAGRPIAQQIQLSLIVGGHRILVRIDGLEGNLTNVVMEGTPEDRNPTSHRGRVLRDDVANTIVCAVRRNGIRLECNQQTVIDWTGDPASIKLWDGWPSHHADRIAVASHSNACHFTRIELAALSPADWRPVVGGGDQVAKNAKKTSKPEGGKLRVATRTVDATYEKQLRAAKSPADRWAVVNRMRQQGANTNDDTALRYALLDEARTRAVGMGQVATACEAVEELARTFEVDVLAAKEEVIVAGLLKTTTPQQLVAGAMVTLSVTDRALAEAAYDRAERLLTAAENAVRKLGVPALTSGAQKRRSLLQLLRSAAEKRQAAVERLRLRSKDAEANRDAGVYELLALSDWRQGLKHLAKAPGQFSDVASMEATAESVPTERLRLADAWKAAADEAPTWKTACLAQAKYWCRRASATLPGQSDPSLAPLAAELNSVAVLNWPRLQPGLRAVLYEGGDFQNPRVWRVDPTLGLNCGMGAPAPGLPGDNFSVRWIGWLYPPVAGKYVFKSYSDDGTRLKIDDKLAIDFWGRGAGEATAEVELTDTPHRLVVEFNDYQVNATFSLVWSLKDLSTEHALPTETLFHDPALE